MGGFRCSECEQTHARYSRCIYHDPDTKVARGLRGHRGLPEDCPGCLGYGTIEKKTYGQRAGDFSLTCRSCLRRYLVSYPGKQLKRSPSQT